MYISMTVFKYYLKKKFFFFPKILCIIEGTDNRTWWPGKWKVFGSKKQNLFQIWSLKKGSNWSKTIWSRKCNWIMENFSRNCPTSLCKRTLSEWRLHCESSSVHFSLLSCVNNDKCFCNILKFIVTYRRDI